MILWLTIVFVIALTSIGIAQDKEWVSRLDFTKQLLKTADITFMPGTASSFEDVTNQDADYVEAAYKNKIVSGYNNRFYPKNPVTKEQAVVMMVKALGEEGVVIRINDEAADTILSFKDKNSISYWAKPYVAYAVKKGMILDKTDIFAPHQLLTKDEVNQMLNNAKKIYDESITREGLTAHQMLQKANQNLAELDSYKFKGEMNIDTKTSSPEAAEQKLHMAITQEGAYQKPEKAYVKSTSIIDADGSEELKDQKQESEIVMDNGMMYIKTEDNEKWLAFDINPIMKEIEKLVGQQNATTGVISSQQLELFGLYATYAPDAVIEDKEYYVVDVDLDYDTFKELYKELLNKIGTYAEASLKSNNKEEVSQADMKEMKQAIVDIINKINMEANYKYYIDKPTKMYHNMEINQNLKMDVEETAVQTNTQGKYTYYDFGEEVNIPQIQPQDTQMINDLFNNTISE